MDQDNQTEQTDEAQAPASEKMPPDDDMSNEAILARALVAKDLNTVISVLPKIRLTARYLGESWSARLVRNFDSEIAQAMDLSGLKPIFPHVLFRLASFDDNAEAFNWLLDHPKLSDFLSFPSTHHSRNYFLRHQPWSHDRDWIKQPNNKECLMAGAFIFSHRSGTEICESLLRLPEFDEIVPVIAQHSQVHVYRYVENQQWDKLDFFINRLSSKLPHDIAQKRVADLLGYCATHAKSTSMWDLNEQMSKFRSFKFIRTLPNFDYSPPYNVYRYFDLSDKRKKKVISFESFNDCMLLSAPPCLEQLLQRPECLQRYHELLEDPQTGHVALATLAANRPGKELVELLPKLMPVLERWRDPNGLNPAHVLMSVRPKAVLAEFFAQQHTHWIVENVEDVPMPVDMIGGSGNNTALLQTQARVKRKLLQKSIGSKPKIKVSPPSSFHM